MRYAIAAERGRVTVVETDWGVVGVSEVGGVVSDCCSFDLFRLRRGEVTTSMILEKLLWPVVFGTRPAPGGGDGVLRPGIGRPVRPLVMRLAIEGFGGFLAGNG